jgi:ribosomal protein S18 acetylase RimI-like enzyme
VAIAVFADQPERSIYNNALVERDLTAVECTAAVDAVEAAYAQAAVTHFAVWFHETDTAMRRDLARRGYTPTESTRAMAIELVDARLPRPNVEVARTDWSEHLRVGELPADLLRCGQHAAFHLRVAKLNGESAATAMAFDLGTDCGIYNVGTLPHARRKGLGTAVTVAHLRDALDRRCETASLQSTPMAEPLYAAIGFRDLGRLLEYALRPARARLSRRP